MTRARILVVDDDPGMLHAVERLLSRSHQVQCCNRPADALDIIEEWNPDLALLDVRMPDMSGFELLQELRRRRPDIDAIIMTGSVHEVDAHMVRAIRAEAYYFIQKPFDREVLLTLVERCLETRRLQDQNRRHVSRLERELQLARHFQRSLLPPESGRFGELSVWARFEPCDEMGGDLYDYVSGEAGSLGLLVADVAGHGVAAAMQTGVVKAAFHACRGDNFDPLAVVHHVARNLEQFPANRFVTLFCARVDSASGQLEYVNAGHPPAILWGCDNRPIRLDSTGALVCSAMRDEIWTQETRPFSPGSHLLIYTDGIIEVEGPAGTFGTEGIEQQIQHSPAGGEALLKETLNSVRAFAGDEPVCDDLTLLAVSCKL